MQYRSSVGILSLLLGGLLACAGGPKDKIVFATDATWPPMEFIDQQGQLVGFDVELAQAIAEAAGFEYEIRNVAWDGIFAGLANEQYDAVISSVTITEERKATLDFSEPYLNAGQVIVVRQGSPYTSFTDLYGKSAGAQIGTTGAMEIAKHPQITLKSFDEVGLAFEALVNGVIEAVVCDSPVAADFALQRQEYRDKLQIVGDVLTEENYGIAVKKGNQAVLDKINAGLAAVKDNGTLDRLKAKWGLK